MLCRSSFRIEAREFYDGSKHCVKCDHDGDLLILFRLALGCVSPRYIYWELKRYMGQKKSNTDGPYWIIFELIWRDFFKYAAMKHGNKFFFSYGRYKLVITLVLVLLSVLP